MTRQEQVDMYMDLEKIALVNMLIEANKHIKKQLTLTDVGCSLPTSTQLIEDCKKRFNELKDNYPFEYRSFFNGYMEGFGKYVNSNKK